MSSYIWKPSTINSWKQGVAFLAPSSADRSRAPIVTDSTGKTYTGKYINTNEGRHQWIFPKELAGMNDLSVQFGGYTGKIGKGSLSYEGSGLEGWAERAKGSLGGYPMGDGGHQFMGPVGVGDFGVAPEYLGGMFPSPFLAQFNPIRRAPFRFTDPIEFGREYGDFAREEMQKNLDFSRSLGQDILEQEIEGLRYFVPRAADIQRQMITLDNEFNVQQRGSAVDAALPGARGDLADQRDRARAYAEGRVPDSITDRQLELTARSRAADQASAAGFGARSKQASRLSDLMSAEQRINLSRYGDQLLSGNINQSANLFLPPTSYATAGSEVRVMPSVSPAQLTTQLFGATNQQTLLDAGTAFSGTVNQRQFETNLEQQTRQFNAQGQFAASQFNATAQNAFAMSQFQYNAGYAAAMAGAAQNNINTMVGLQQQAQNQQIFQDYLNKTQDSNTYGAIASGVGSIISGVGSLFGGTAQQPATTDAQGRPVRQPSGMMPIDDGTGGDAADAVYPPLGDFASSSTVPGGLNIPSGEPVPTGYVPITNNTDGTTTVIPDSAYQGQMASMATDTGIEVPEGAYMPAAHAATATMSNAGMSYQQLPGFVPAGYDFSGRPVYSNAELAQSNNIEAGATLASTADGVLRPLGVFSGSDGLTQIGQAAAATGTITQLTELAARGDSQGFINAAINAVARPVARSLAKNPQDQAGVTAAFSAYNLFQNWDKMSAAQKSLGLASLGIQAYKFTTGENLAAKAIPATQIDGASPMTVGQAMNLFAAGYNVYSMVNNWDQLNTLQKISGGTNTVASIAATAKQMGLLGAGETGAAVAVNGAELAAAGWSTAPSMGVGAISAPAGTAIPAGYVATGTAEGATIAVPAATAQSSATGVAASGTGATGTGTAAASSGTSTLGMVAGGAAIAAGAYSVYQNWGAGGTKGATNGALGGAAIASGLYVLGATNPFLLAAVVAFSAAGGAIKAGKSEDQLARDAVRNLFQRSGLADDDDMVMLADGTKVDIGIDGHGGYHSWKDPSRRTDAHKDKDHLNAWDADYTNDLDYSSSMMGSTLSKLLAGNQEKNVRQLGGQLANAALGNIGFGKEFNTGNLEKLAANFRAMYSRAGIKSKSDAYQLANQGYAEGRWNESDTIAMHQAINMIYNDDRFDTAAKLMAGRWRGLEVAAKDPVAPVPADKRPAAQVEVPMGPGVGDFRNPVLQLGPGGRPVPPNLQPIPRPTPPPTKQTPRRVPMTARTPEMMRIRNQQRYAAAAR